MKRQLAFILARSLLPIEWIEPAEVSEDDQEDIPEDLLECLGNARLSQHLKDFGKELGVSEPKSLEDIYKSHLENTRLHFSCQVMTLDLLIFYIRCF